MKKHRKTTLALVGVLVVAGLALGAMVVLAQERVGPAANPRGRGRHLHAQAQPQQPAGSRKAARSSQKGC